ncbi:unnamed protein product [Linum trigynum]|uniref:Uncharacterized protein n=1 Tax=Linum trigynum TaxID=586398 RepID=A0AAV2CSH2_9ROSI
MKEVLIGVLQSREPNPENRPAAVKMVAEAVMGAAATTGGKPSRAAAGADDALAAVASNETAVSVAGATAAGAAGATTVVGGRRGCGRGGGWIGRRRGTRPGRSVRASL